MNPQLIGQVGVLLGSLGAALQYARAKKAFPEWVYLLIAAILAAFGFYLAMDAPVDHWKKFLLDSWPIYLTLLGTVLGGNAAASNAAKGLVKIGFDPANPLIPLTDSK